MSADDAVEFQNVHFLQRIQCNGHGFCVSQLQLLIGIYSLVVIGHGLVQCVPRRIKPLTLTCANHLQIAACRWQ